MKFYCNKVIGFTKKAVRLSIGGGYIKIAYYDYIGNIDIAGNWIFYGDNDGLVYGKNRRKSKKRATRLIRDRICTFNAKEAIMENSLPKHIAIIMDGNGRWAKKRFMPRSFGHRAGAQTLNKLLKEADKIGIEHITVYAFSTENWTRPKDEVNSLMNLLREYIDDYIKDNETSNIKIDSIGDLSRLDEDLRNKINTLKEISSCKKGLNLHIGLNYGGRDEIMRAVKKMYGELKSGNIKESDINEELFSSYLDTKGIPDPELIIRTSGEMRLSNFLPWQTTYSEIYISDKLWPDFNINELNKAIEHYKNRDRRFGGR